MYSSVQGGNDAALFSYKSKFIGVVKDSVPSAKFSIVQVVPLCEMGDRV